MKHNLLLRREAGGLSRKMELDALGGHEVSEIGGLIVNAMGKQTAKNQKQWTNTT
jgi:hypothetical protein